MENMDVFHADLINHVWKKCINSNDGRALFHGDTLARNYMDAGSDWVDAFAVLRGMPEIKVSAFYLDGLREKIFEVEIDPVLCNPLVKQLQKRLARQDAAILKMRGI